MIRLIRPWGEKLFRFIDVHLQQWANDKGRKPLLLRGARQVGKTFAVRKLGQTFANYIEVNFEETPRLRNIFSADLDLSPQRIVRDLSLALKIEIIPGKTLLFFDEIQTVPQAIIALRYFYEKMPELHVIAAGSLLDFTIEQVGVPVGRVDFLYLYPLSWIEFLIAMGYGTMVQEILGHDHQKSESEFVHDKILEILREYFAIGGMPEVVAHWAESKDPMACAKIHQLIIQSYRQDFQKYAKSHQIKYVELIFEEALHQLGRKFQFRQLQGEYRKRELLPALDLLEKAGVLHRVYHSDGQGIPLGAGKNLSHFKLIFLDIGLSQALLGLDFADWFLNGKPAFINKGPIVEAFVGQEILCYSPASQKTTLYYWQREKKGSEAEVDYLIQERGKIIPVEVKSEKGRSLKSLYLFLETHVASEFGIRFSVHNYSVHNRIHSYPLYAVPAALNLEQTLEIIRHLLK